MNRKKEIRKRLFIQSLIVLLSMFFGILIYIIYLDGQIHGYEKSAIASKLGELKYNESNVESIIQEASSSIVGISKIKNKGTSIFVEKGIETLGIGSGIIISNNGYILTNEHVSRRKK